MEFSPESSKRTGNSLEESENEEIASLLTTSSDPTETRANVNATMQSALMDPDAHTERGDEIDEILAAAALQGMQHPMTIPDASQNNAARPTEGGDRWPALGNVSQGNQITVGSGSGEITDLSHAMDLPSTGGFDSTWTRAPWDQAQRQSENNPRRQYVPVSSSDVMEPPRKRSRLDHQINPDAAAPAQVITPPANTTSVPTTMTSLQQNEASRKETG